MAIDSQRLAQQMEAEMSTRYGQSLLYEKTKMDSNSVAVFIGLGGLGSRAVNTIKGIAKEKLNDHDQQFYLIVDSDYYSMNALSAPEAQDFPMTYEDMPVHRHGHMQSHEKMALYRDTYRIDQIGSHVNSWLNRQQLDQRIIDAHGAQSVRQIGRLSLCATQDLYDEYYDAIYDLMRRANACARENQRPLFIYLLSGLGGGTGSGIIVDIAYMVRKAMADIAVDYHMEAILFTPDVQKNDNGLTPNFYRTLGANFYAAMKEIDAFYHNRSRNTAYHPPVGEYHPSYKDDVFDECTLVSRYIDGMEIAHNSHELLVKVANALLLDIGEWAAVETDDHKWSSFTSLECRQRIVHNHCYHFNFWYRDKCSTLALPDFYSYRYGSLGYTSYYIPCDEIVASCAHKLMGRLMQHWSKYTDVKEVATKILKQLELNSNRHWAHRLFTMSNCSERFDVESRDLPKDGIGPLPVKNCRHYLDTMETIAHSENHTVFRFCNSSVAESHLPDAINHPLLAAIHSAFAFGPLYARALLCDEILPAIRDLLESLDKDILFWEKELHEQSLRLRKLAETYDGKLSVNPTDLAQFTQDCRQYGEQRVMLAFLEKSQPLLNKLHRAVEEEVENKYGIVFTILDSVTAMLQKDHDYVQNPYRRRVDGVTSFTFDLVNFDPYDAKTHRVNRFIEQLVDDCDIEQCSHAFINDIVDHIFSRLSFPERYYEAELTEEDVIHLLRSYFRDRLSPLTNNMVEKICTIACTPDILTPDTLSSALETPELLNVALQRVANDIDRKLSIESGAFLSSSHPEMSLEEFMIYKSTACSNSMQNLVSFLTCPTCAYMTNNRSEYIACTRIYGFPLPWLADLRTYREWYEQQAMAPGIHIEEGERNLRYLLPEPYDYTAALVLHQYDPSGRDVTEPDRTRMNHLWQLAKKAQALGILLIIDPNAHLYGPTPLHYHLIPKPIYFCHMDKEQILAAMKEKLAEHTDEIPSMLSLVNEIAYLRNEPMPIFWSFSQREYNIMQNATDLGDENAYGNFIRLLYSSYTWQRLLSESVEAFSLLKEIYDKAIAAL